MTDENVKICLRSLEAHMSDGVFPLFDFWLVILHFDV
jgi:hypothetical protein